MIIQVHSFFPCRCIFWESIAQIIQWLLSFLIKKLFRWNVCSKNFKGPTNTILLQMTSLKYTITISNQGKMELHKTYIRFKVKWMKSVRKLNIDIRLLCCIGIEKCLVIHVHSIKLKQSTFNLKQLKYILIQSWKTGMDTFICVGTWWPLSLLSLIMFFSRWV